MNFLAHLYLSGDNNELLIGNFIADSVKGKQFQQFSPGIRQGIILHRLIDEFTDSHPLFSQGRNRLRGSYGKFAPVIVDIFYDYFLATDWNNYSDQPLKEFSENIYRIMQNNLQMLPLRAQRILPYMIEQDWLTGYSTLDGINKTLLGMSRRTKFNSGMENAVSDLKLFNDVFREEFRLFFPDVIHFSNQFRQNNPLAI